MCALLLCLGAAAVPGQAAGAGEPTFLKGLLDVEALGAGLLQSLVPQASGSPLGGSDAGLMDSLNTIVESVEGM